MNIMIRILILLVFIICGWCLESSKMYLVKINCVNGVSKILLIIYVCVSGRILLVNLKSLLLSWVLVF